MDRLEIHIPPGGIKGARASGPAPDREREHPPVRLTIDEIVASAAQLQIASKDPAKLPRVFDIHDLHIFEYGQKDGASFRASLTNPKPQGHIATTGVFGPWNSEEPRTTPVRGKYTFTNADLNTIKGLDGTLSSHGEYTGVLERIAVTGETDMPDFSIDIAGEPVPLKTTFKAIVDGTNGNTYLEEVDARLIDSHILAKGSVVRTKDVKGRHVALDIVIDQARIEDLLKLAIKGAKTPLTGAVKVKTTFNLPAGELDVIQRLRLAGEFALDKARFTNFNVQKRHQPAESKRTGRRLTGRGGKRRIGAARAIRTEERDVVVSQLDVRRARRNRGARGDLSSGQRKPRFHRPAPPRCQFERNDVGYEGRAGHDCAAALSAEGWRLAHPDQDRRHVDETQLRARCETRVRSRVTLVTRAGCRAALTGPRRYNSGSP